MAFINCPECGASISDKALSCPHCGAPVKSASSISHKEEKIYFDKIVLNTKCRITSLEWSIGNKIIPTHSVSKVELQSFPFWNICSLVGILAVLLFSLVLGFDDVFVILEFLLIVGICLGIALFFISVFMLWGHHIIVYDISGMRTSNIKTKYEDKALADELYYATSRCVKENQD